MIRRCEKCCEKESMDELIQLNGLFYTATLIKVKIKDKLIELYYDKLKIGDIIFKDDIIEINNYMKPSKVEYISKSKIDRVYDVVINKLNEFKNKIQFI